MGKQMQRIRLAYTLVASLAAAAGIVGSVQASTIDTFNFSQIGWFYLDNTPVPQGLFSGSFSGVVEPGNTINLPDLTSFNASFSISGKAQYYKLQNLSLFSFTTTGGPSSLGIIANQDVVNGVCTGAPVVLTTSCGNVSAPTAFGALFFAQSNQTESLTYTQPAVTLVSSVTAPTPVPEPRSVLVFLSGVITLGALIYRRRHRGSWRGMREHRVSVS